MVAESRSGLLPIPCHSGQHASAGDLCISRRPAVAILVDPPQSARLCNMVPTERALQKMDSLTTRSAHSPYATLRRHSSKVEAVCVNAHVRIRAGGAG